MTRTFNSSDTPLHSLKQAIEGLHIAMLTTTDADGRFSSKPMYLLEHDAQGQFWFFTQSPADMLDPSEPYRRANLAFSAEGSSRYVSVSCVGEIVHDRQRIEELWSPMAKAAPIACTCARPPSSTWPSFRRCWSATRFPM